VSPAERDRSSVFGLAHQYLPLGKPGCLAVAACDGIEERADSTSASRNSTHVKKSACNAMSFTSLQQHLTQVQYPCTATDIKDYYYGTGSTEPRSHSSAELAHGMYASQLKSLLRLYPAAQLQVLFQENMLADLRTALDDVQGFLGVPKFDLLAEGAAHGLSLRGGNDDTHGNVGKATATGRGVKDLIASAFKEVKSMWRKVSKSWNKDSTDGNVDAFLSSSARLQASLPPATKALLVASYAKANRDLQLLLQELPEVRHCMGRELPSAWAV